MADSPNSDNYDTIARAFARGEVIPFLGAGASICNRSAAFTGPGTDLPLGGELARYLAGRVENYPDASSSDLLKVAQYQSVIEGTGPLYRELRKVFNRDYPITDVHRLLSRLPALHRQAGEPSASLILTTNYDDLTERAFDQQGQAYDVLVYVADSEQESQIGKFWHYPPGQAQPTLVQHGNDYLGIPQDDEQRLIRPCIVKLHGAVDRRAKQNDSYVITEDHYIDYLTRTNDVAGLLPAAVLQVLKGNHLLFLGYGLGDWNLRVILHRIWGRQKLSYKSWAIQHKSEPVEDEAWKSRDVTIFNVDLAEFVRELEPRLIARLPSWPSP